MTADTGFPLTPVFSGVDYSLTHSCDDSSPDALACGRCDSCKLRLEAFTRLGVPDPIPYVGD